VTEAETQSVRERIVAMRMEHDDLDAVIARLCESQVYSDEQIHRLKKKKLYLKDQVEALERRLSVATH
jgi:hypothetical protein